MKKAVLSLLFLLHFFAINAQQYNISWILKTGTPYYECTVVPSSLTSTLNKDDLITWIFPDGQFFQKKIETDQSGTIITNQSNTTLWQPAMNAPSGPNTEVIAYVAKKGQPGTPPKRAVPISPPITGNFNGSPSVFAMNPTKRWQINRTWEFAPSYETFLIISYKIGGVCDAVPQPNKIKLTYDPLELNLVKATPTENLAYQNEVLTGPNTINGIPLLHEVELTNFKYNTNDMIINHVYLKFKLENSIRVGKEVKIAVSGSICGEAIIDTMRYIAKGTPHDPNEKIVNDPSICSTQPGPTPLQYYIQFHNDGAAPVNDVDIEDNLPTQLIPTTCILNPKPSLSVLKYSGVTGNKFLVQFQNLQLPGLKQTNPHYAYDQTCYDFTFDVSAQANLATGSFSNSADVYFFGSSGRLSVVPTNNSIVTIDSCTTPSREQITLINSLKIIPNPSSNEFNIFIELAEKTSLIAIIRDLNGHILEEVTQKEYLDGAYWLYWNSANIPSGMYILDINTERGRSMRKIIKI